jgi:ATP-dependent Clp protease adaptor protein ClpS
MTRYGRLVARPAVRLWTLWALILVWTGSNVRAFTPSPIRPSFVATTLTRLPVSLRENGGGGPAVLDRPQVLERTTKQEQQSTTVRRGNEAWEVRIYNDGMNTREHVARCLVQVTSLSEVQAYTCMMQAHQHGMAVVGRWVYEIAEMYHAALQDHGIVCDLVPVEEE